MLIAAAWPFLTSESENWSRIDFHAVRQFEDAFRDAPELHQVICPEAEVV